MAIPQALLHIFTLSVIGIEGVIDADFRQWDVLIITFLPRDATQSAVLPRQVVSPSVRSSVCDDEVSWSLTPISLRRTRPPSSAESRPPLPKFSGYVEVEAHYIFHPSTIWVWPLFTELGPKKTQKGDFAMKQTNICRLSGDINYQATLCIARS